MSQLAKSIFDKLLILRILPHRILGGNKLIEDGAKTLKELSSIIDTTKMKSPSFIMVLTGTGEYAYRRKDGVYVVPIGCLKD